MAEQKEKKEAPITAWLSTGKVKTAVARVLPKHLSPERLIQIAIIAITKSPQLQRCTPLSIVGGVIEASELGLSLEPSLGQAYLVPFWNSKSGMMEAQMIPGYRGLVHLARNSGLVRNVRAEVVRKDDKFEIEYGTSPRLVHVPNLKAGDRYNPETWVGVYAVAEFTREWPSEFVYLERELVYKIRQRSKAFNPGGDKKASGPWVTDEEEMWKKTATRRECKQLPQATELQSMHRAAAVDENRELDIDASPLVDLSELAGLNPPATAGELTTGDGENGPQRKKKDGESQEPARTATQSSDATDSAPAATEQPKGIDVHAFYDIGMQQSIAMADLKKYVITKYNVERGILDLTHDQAAELDRDLRSGAVAKALAKAGK